MTHRVLIDGELYVHNRREGGYLTLSKKQAQVLGDTLRFLDLVNAYEEGDNLRRAFKVELDGLRNKKRE